MLSSFTHRCLLVLLGGTALAASIQVSSAAPIRYRHHASTPRTTQSFPVPVAASVVRPVAASIIARSQPEEIAVTGRSSRTRQPGGGLLRVETAPKAVQTITHDFIAKLAPSVNLQQVIAMLPSTNVTQADPFGLYTGQTNVRGFDTTEVGWLLDGAPLNDIGSGQFYANEVLESENLNNVSMQPGSVNIDTPVVSASAGMTTMTMSNPTHHFGGVMDVSVGSFDTFREFIRLNSGDMGNSGLRAMFAFSHTKGNMWRGPGQAEKYHYDFKMVKDFRNGSRSGLTVAYNDQTNGFYLAPNLSQWRTTGYSTNYTADFAQPTADGPNPDGPNYYKLHVNPYENVVAALPTHIVITPKLTLEDSLYFWHGIGSGTGASIIGSSSYMGNQAVKLDLGGASKVLALAPSSQEQFRTGNTISLHYHPDHHHDISLGWWYEYANLYQYSPFGIVNQSTGQAANIRGTAGTIQTTTGQPFRARDFLSLTQVNMIFIGDTMKYFNDRLNIQIGFKEAMVTRRIYNYLPGSQYNRNLHTSEPLPQIGISWNFNKRHQIYISGSTNFKVPSNTSLVDYYNTSGLQTQQGGSSKPEYTIEEELGYRYNGELVVGSISFFNYNLTNRQQTLSYYDGNAGASYSRTVNAGGQTTRGVDIQLATRAWHHLRPYATFEYLHSTIDNNIRVGMDFLPTAGKIAIRAPSKQAKLGLDYDLGGFWISGQVIYVGKQYASFMNDSSVPQYITNQVGMGYRFKNVGFMKSPQVQLNMTNLTGAKFRNGVYGFTTNLNQTKGINGTMIASGGQPIYYLNPPFSAMVTLSTGF